MWRRWRAQLARRRCQPPLGGRSVQLGYAASLYARETAGYPPSCMCYGLSPALASFLHHCADENSKVSRGGGLTAVRRHRRSGERMSYAGGVCGGPIRAFSGVRGHKAGAAFIGFYLFLSFCFLGLSGQSRWVGAGAGDMALPALLGEKVRGLSTLGRADPQSQRRLAQAQWRAHIRAHWTEGRGGAVRASR